MRLNFLRQQRGSREWPGSSGASSGGEGLEFANVCREQLCLAQSAQCLGKGGTWNPVSFSTASSELLRLPSQQPN